MAQTMVGRPQLSFFLDAVLELQKQKLKNGVSECLALHLAFIETADDWDLDLDQVEKVIRGDAWNEVLVSKRPEEADCSDFILKESSCWIERGDLSLYIVSGEGCMIVEATPTNDPETTLESMVVFRG